MALTIGCDPEVFGAKEGHYTSLIGKIGGTKGNPIPLPHGGGVQEDNLAIEFNTKPATSQKDFIKAVTEAREDVRALMKQHGVRLASTSVANFRPLDLDCDAAKEFGCDPDFNAWTLEPNPIPDLHGSNRRCGGGHVHIGWDFKSDMERIHMARLMDIFHGIPSIHEDPLGATRRQWYGKAGAHRPKPYGIESRILSNYWIFNSDDIRNIFRRVKLAYKFLPQAEVLIDTLGAERLITTINNHDRKEASQINHEVNLFIGEQV